MKSNPPMNLKKRWNTQQPKVQRLPVYPTDESLPAVLERMASHLPITDKAELNQLLCIFQNTWLDQQGL